MIGNNYSPKDNQNYFNIECNKCDAMLCINVHVRRSNPLTDKNNKFRPQSIFNLLSYFKFQTYFSYFQKAIANSNFHKVEKQVEQKR